jgi:glycosyltransferase involved in cell wall biosynthesis
MHILFLTDNFPPETNAPASRTYEHAKRWVASGHHVTVVTGAPNFPNGRLHEGYRNRLWQRETLDGIEVVRVWTYITPNSGLIRRVLDYLSFMVTSAIAGMLVQRPDVVVGTSPQFFTPCAAWFVSKVRRRPFVFELRDLWPDAIVAVGALPESFAIRLLRRVEYFLYRRAARIVSVTHSFVGVLARNGIPAEKIVVVPNGVDPSEFVPGPKARELEAKLGLEGKFVAAYVGTIGMAHGLAKILEAARKLESRPDIAFVVVGTGAELSKLADRSEKEGLANVLFVGAVSKEVVKQYWRLCDVALVLLRNTPFFETVIPSKIFEAMGTGRPIILGVRGESQGILAAAQAGIPIAPESSDELVDAILTLAGDPERRASLGESGRQFVVREYDRRVLADRMLQTLEEVAKSG